MARVLILSSWVAHGHVGAAAGAPALQALGHAVTVLPTVILSNHPGWPHVAGRPVAVEDLEAMAGALDANGWLAGLDAVQTGYLPTPGHVAFAADLIDRLSAGPAAPRIWVDPVLGDRPKGLYVAETAAQALRDRLLPRASAITPNLFELGWLSGRPVDTVQDAAAAAAALLDTDPKRPDPTGADPARARAAGAEAAAALPDTARKGQDPTGAIPARARAATSAASPVSPQATAPARLAPGARVLVTSPPMPDGRTGLLAVSRGAVSLYATPRHEGVPHGVGDVLAALLAAGLPPGRALGHLAALVGASLGADHLAIAAAAPVWTRAAPIQEEMPVQWPSTSS